MGSVGKSIKKGLNFLPGGALVPDLFGGGKDPGVGQANEVRSLYGQAQAQQGQLHAQQTAALQRGINKIPQSYAKARTAAGDMRNVSLQRAADTGAQQTAQASQSLASRGLYNSTVLDNARSGISSGVTRDLADIDSAYSQILGQLDLGEGQAQMQGQSALAGVFGQQAGANSALLQNQATTLAGIQYEDPNAWLNSLLGIGGTIAGTYIGKNL